MSEGKAVRLHIKLQPDRENPTNLCYSDFVVENRAKKINLTQKLKTHKKLVWGVGIFIILYTVSLFVPLVWPYTQYPLYVIKCLGRPLITNGGGSYVTPDSSTYNVGLLSTGFFCTEQEAQAAGYRKSLTNDE